MGERYDTTDYIFLPIFIIGIISIIAYFITYTIFGAAGLSEVIRPEYSLRILQIVVSGALTFGLILLYSQQKEILREQVKLKRSELGGDIFVNSCDFGEEEVVINLSNPSNSEVTDIKVFTEIFPKQIGQRDLNEVKGKRMEREGKNSTEFGRPATLSPGERGVSFSGKCSVFYVDEDGSEMIQPLGFFISNIKNEGVDELYCRIWVEGEDQLGNKVSSRVLRWDKTIRVNRFSAVNPPDLQDIFSRSVSAPIDNERSEYSDSR